MLTGTGGLERENSKMAAAGCIGIQTEFFSFRQTAEEHITGKLTDVRSDDLYKMRLTGLLYWTAVGDFLVF